MALVTIQSGTKTQSNDSTTERILDNSGTYGVSGNTTGWGSPNTEVTDITTVVDAIANDGIALTLTVTFTNPSDPTTEVVYDVIDLCDEFGTFSTEDDLVFDITPALLKVSGTAIGTSNTLLTDGWYQLDYSIKQYLSGSVSAVNTDTDYVLIDGQSRTTVYDLMRQVPYLHDFDFSVRSNLEWKTIIDPIYKWSLFQGMLSNLSIGRKSEILTTLDLINRLI